MSISFISKFYNFVFKSRHGIHFCCRCRGPRNTSTTHKIRLCHKSTKSGFRNASECEKCQKIIDAIFGNGKYGENTTISYQDGLDIQAMDRSKLSQIITQIHVNPETKLQKCQRIISQALGGMEDNAANEILTKLDAKILKAVETVKQNEEKLITKIEKLNEHDNTELPIANEKRGPQANEINIQHSNFTLNKINNDNFDLNEDFVAVTKKCLNVLPEHIDGLILKQLEVFNRPKSLNYDERIVPPLSYVVNNIINEDSYSNTLFFKREGSKGDQSKQTVFKREVRAPKSSPKIQNTEPPAPLPMAPPKIIPTPSSSPPGHEKLSPAFQPSITDKPLHFEGMAHYDIDSQVFHMEAFLAPCREVILNDYSGHKYNKGINEIPTNVKDGKLFKEAAYANFNENVNEKIPMHTGSIERNLNKHADKGIIENYHSNPNSGINEEFAKSLEINKREIKRKYNLYLASKNKKDNLNLNSSAENIQTNSNSKERNSKIPTDILTLNTNSNINEEFVKSLQINKREISKKYNLYIASKNKKETVINTVKANKYDLIENNNSKTIYPLYNPQCSKPITFSEKPDVKHIIETNAKVNDMDKELNKIHSQNLNIESTKLNSPLDTDLDRHQSKPDMNEKRVKKVIENSANGNNMLSDPKIKTSQYLNTESTKPDTSLQTVSDRHQSESNSNERKVEHIMEDNSNIKNLKDDPKPTTLASSKQSKKNIIESPGNSHHTLLPPVFDFQKGKWINIPEPKKGSSQLDTQFLISEKKNDYLCHTSANKENTSQGRTSVSNDMQTSAFQPTKGPISGPILKDKTYTRSHDNIPITSSYKENRVVQLKKESDVNYVSDYSKPWLIHPTNRENLPSHTPNKGLKEIKTKYDENTVNLKSEQAEGNIPILTKCEIDKKVQFKTTNISITNKQDSLNSTAKDDKKFSKDDYTFPNISRTCSYTKEDKNIRKWSDSKNDNNKYHWHMAHRPHTCCHNHYLYNKHFHNPFYKTSEPNATNTVLHSAGVPDQNKDKQNQKIEANSPIFTRNIVASVEKHKEDILNDNRNAKIKPELVNNPTSLDAVQIPSVEKQKEDDKADNKMTSDLVRDTTTLDDVQNILNANASQVAPKEEEIGIKPIETVEQPAKVQKKRSLQQLLKEVRARNSKEAAEQKKKLRKKTEDPVGKCGDKKPPCPPPPPVCPPPPPPPECPKPCPKPEPKPTCPPEPCAKPRKPCPKKTCFTKSEDTPQIIIGNSLSTPDLKLKKNDIRILDTNLVKSMCYLEQVYSDCKAVIENIIDDIFFYVNNNNNSLMSRSFDPWTPIPSWPISKRERKRPFLCPKEGCKLPVPKMTETCREKPCHGFPKRER